MRRSKDYIETAADRMGRADACREYMATHKDPRKSFMITYEWCGNKKENDGPWFAYSETEVRKMFMAQWIGTGVVPKIISVVEVTESTSSAQP